jgi:rhamnose utilization protein RhaD (predicted bifunctional aldolase and dehydrogenase)
MNELSELVKISNEIGKSRDLVQAGGGNTSVKTEDGRMVIKASGFTFSEMTETSGFVFFSGREDTVDLPSNEQAYNQSLANSMIDSTMPRPSMEAGMHAFLHRVVIHTHPVMANIINCMKDGEKVARELFSDITPEFLWLDYKNPGYSLSNEIKNRVESYERVNGVKPELIFLKNHGIIVSGDDSSKCLKMTVDINERIYQYLKGKFSIERFPGIELDTKDNMHFNGSELVTQFVMKLDENKQFLSRFLIPDDAVYCSAFSIQEDASNLDKITFGNQGVFYPFNEKKAKKLNEMLSAKLYILSAISRIGEVEFLKDEDVDYVLNMENEKYRQSLS